MTSANKPESSPGSKFVTTNDNVHLFYEEKGEGAAVVLIHGWSGSSRLFMNNFDELAESFRVIRYDLRGHGNSDKPKYGNRVSRLAMDLNNILDHFRLERAAVVGCSLGCAVIWNYVELFGAQRLSAAVFVDQSPYQLYAADGSWRLGSNGLFSPSALTHLVTMLNSDARACHIGTVAACLTRRATQDEEAFFVSEGLKAPGWLLGALMADHNNNDWRPTLPLVSCPSLVFAGKQSKIFPWEGVAYAADVMPRAKLVTFDEGSHWLYFEEPERFNSLVTSFLKDVQSQE